MDCIVRKMNSEALGSLLSPHMNEGTEKTHKNYGSNNYSLYQDLKPEPHEYEAGELTTRP
jgi:hypothetical protein